MSALRVCVRAASFVTGASILTGAAVAAAAPLQPVGKWLLDYQAAQCVAARDYGSERKPTSLAIRPAPNGETYELIVAEPGHGPEYGEELEGSVDFGRGPIKAWLLRYRTDDKKRVLYVFRIPAPEITSASTASAVRLSGRRGIDVTFSLTSLPALLAGLQDCTADLMRYWNYGGEKDGRIAQPATGDIRRIFTSDDFPQQGLDRRQQGKGRFMLLVDEKGSIAACHVLETSGIPVFDARSCQVIRERARFKPALDPSGKPIRSTVVTPQIIWRLEG